MEYKISDRAKKVTIGVAIVGLVMFVIGFFQQKDFVYPKIIDDHNLFVEYSGELTKEKETELIDMITSSMELKGFSVEIHKEEEHHGHEPNHSSSNHTNEASQVLDANEHESNYSTSDHGIVNHHQNVSNHSKSDKYGEDANGHALSQEHSEPHSDKIHGHHGPNHSSSDHTNEDSHESNHTNSDHGLVNHHQHLSNHSNSDKDGENANGHVLSQEHSESHSDDSHGHHGPNRWKVHVFNTSHSSHSLEASTHDDDHVRTDEQISHSHSGHNHGDSPSAVLSKMLESGEISFFDSGIRRFWSNLLINGFFFFGIALGAIFYLALHYATESGWGVVLLRLMEGIMSAMPLGICVLLLVFIAATFEWNHIYPWMDSHIVDPQSSSFDPIIYGKMAYLNKPFFWIRVIAYFATFYLFLRWFKKKSRQEDVEGGTKTHFKMYRRAALFLVFFAVFSSTMSWDFIMSIDTHWFSTLFGWYVFSGIWLSGMIMLMMITLYLRSQGHLPFVKESHIHDVGKWMFALSFLWSYLWFSQFMLIWYANIPEEVIYFTQRIEDYKVLFIGTFIVNFIFPMVFLMSADTKRSAGYLIVVGLIIFIGHWLDVYTMVTPGTLFDQWEFGLLEIGMFMLFLGTFVFLVLRAISKAPLLQQNHPYLDESKHHEF